MSLYPYNFSLFSFSSLYVIFYIISYILFYVLYEMDVVQIARKLSKVHSILFYSISD